MLPTRSRSIAESDVLFLSFTLNAKKQESIAVHRSSVRQKYFLNEDVRLYHIRIKFCLVFFFLSQVWESCEWEDSKHETKRYNDHFITYGQSLFP